MTESSRKSSEKRQSNSSKKDCGCGCSGDCGGKKNVEQIASQQPKYTQSEVNEARRTISKIAVASPVLMSLVSKSALGGVACSPSGAMSGNISGHDHTECTGNGCTPGFWKQNLDAWGCAGKSPGTCQRTNGSGKCMEWNTAGGDTFEDCFGFAFPLSPTYPDSAIPYTLLDVMLDHENWGAIGTYYFHLCAALLNSLCAPFAYGSTDAEIIAFADQVEEGEIDKITAKDVLDRMNNAGNCYINSHGKCIGGWVFAPERDGTGQCIPSCPEGYVFDFCQNICRPEADEIPPECRQIDACPDGETWDFDLDMCVPIPTD